MAVLVSDLQNMVEKKIGLNHANEGSLVLSWLTEGYRDMHNKLHIAPAAISISITSGTDEYTLATTIEAIEDVTVIGSTVKPTRVTIDEILDRRRFVSSGVASGDIFVYALEGNLLMVYPTPTSNFTFTVYGTIEPVSTDFAGTENLTSGLALVPLEPLRRCMEYYALWQAAEYDDKVLSERALDYKTQYDQAIVEAKKALRRRSGRGLNPARVGYPGRRGFPKRNDVYPQIDR